MTGGRTGGLLMLGLVLTAGAPARLTAQVSVHLGAGARYGTALVHDSIVVPIDLRPAVAPVLVLSVRDELRGPWSAEASLDIAPSGLRRVEGGATYDAGSVTAVAITVGLSRGLWGGASLRAGVGGLVYAAEARGVFREGSGGLFPLGTAAITVAPGFGIRRRLALEARYDVHRFITPALRTQGFRDPRWVHRAALLVRVGWGRREGRAP